MNVHLSHKQLSSPSRKLFTVRYAVNSVDITFRPFTKARRGRYCVTWSREFCDPVPARSESHSNKCGAVEPAHFACKGKRKLASSGTRLESVQTPRVVPLPPQRRGSYVAAVPKVSLALRLDSGLESIRGSSGDMYLPRSTRLTPWFNPNPTQLSVPQISEQKPHCL